MPCSITYTLTGAFDTQNPNVESEPWYMLDTEIFGGNIDVLINNVQFKNFDAYLLNFSANFIFALRSLLFYHSAKEIVIYEETSNFLLLSPEGNNVEVAYCFRGQKNIEKKATVNLPHLINAVGAGHEYLLKKLFSTYPNIKKNNSFMYGYPDALLVSQRLTERGGTDFSKSGRPTNLTVSSD